MQSIYDSTDKQNNDDTVDIQQTGNTSQKNFNPKQMGSSSVAVDDRASKRRNSFGNIFKKVQDLY